MIEFRKKYLILLLLVVKMLKNRNKDRNKDNYDSFVVLSYALLKQTGWTNPIQNIENLHCFFRSKYNDSIDFCGEAGSLLRTLSVPDYFKFVEYDGKYYQ